MAAPFNVQQLPTKIPQQMQGLQNLIGQLGQTQPNINAISQRARHNFQTQTIPSIAERFTGMGAGGQGSSAFRAALGSSASDLESQLAGLESQFGLQQQGLLAQLLEQNQFENIVTPQQPGVLSGLAGPLGQGVGTAGTLLGASYLSSLGGSAGTAAGAGAAGTAAAAGTAGTAASAAAPGALAALGGSAAAAAPYLLPLLALLAAGYGTYSYFKD